MLRSVDNGYKTYAYNAAGQMSSSYYEHYVNSVLQYENYETISYSGDGQVVKIATTHDPVEGSTETDASYQIHSTVLGGQTITKTDSTGGNLESAIVAAGSTVAKAFSDNSAIWTHFDPNTDSIRSTDTNGTVVDYDNDYGKLELDGSGRNVGLTNPYTGDPQWDNIPNLYNAHQSVGQMINGMPVTYKFNGLNVPEKYFQDMTEFSFFNIFGLQAQLIATQTIYERLPPLDTPGFVPGQNPLIHQGAQAYADFVVNGKVYRNYYKAVDVASWSVSRLLFATYQSNQLAPLTTEKLNAINNAKSELYSRLKENRFSAKCKEMVLDKLNKLEGFSMEKFLSFLGQSASFYDGEKSTAMIKDYYQSAAPPGGWNNQSIAEYFEKRDGLHAFVADGPKVSNFTVFFDPDFIETASRKSEFSNEKLSGLTNDNLTFIFHEALHGFGNSIGKSSGRYDDEGLSKLFYGDKVPPGGSIVISNYIKEHCF